MIITVTLNPAIDVSYQVKNMQIDQVHRTEAGMKTAGGKGLNVSRVLSILGESPLCTGFLGGNNGEWIQEKLDEEDLQHNFIPISGETRTCLAFLDEENGSQTEILEKGPTISEEEQEQFELVFKELLAEASLIIASGSLPAGLPTDFYKEMGEWARAANVPLILDTSGEALKAGIEGKPYLIKPNKEELSQYSNKKNLTLEEMIQVAKEICFQGVEYVLVSMGADGALLIGHDVVLKAEIPTIQAINAVGSGDSTVAGIAYALTQKEDLTSALKWACACGMANALEEKTGVVNIETVQQLISEINIIEL